MGPWPLFYYHTSFSSRAKCGISFMDVGQETFKELNKIRKPNKGHNSRVMGPWPLFYYHTLCYSGTKCGISFMGVGPQTFKLLNKMWSHRITEFRNDRRAWQIQYSPTFSKRGYNKGKIAFYHWSYRYMLGLFIVANAF